MLIAVGKKKSRNRHKLREDEITSSIFGPLSYAQADDVFDVFYNIISQSVSVDDVWPTNQPTSVNFSFWPNISREGRIEPDITVDFFDVKNLLLKIIIEVKWHSLQSSKDESGKPNQLKKQWDAVDNKDRTIHLYIVSDKLSAEKELFQMFENDNKMIKEQHRQHLVCLGWHQLAESLSVGKVRNSAIRRWCENVVCFLDNLGVSRFKGFESLEAFPIVALDDKRVFYRPFNGFNFSIKFSTLNLCSTDNIFFKV